MAARIVHSENIIITNFETRLHLECSSPAFKRYASCKNTTRKGQNQNIVSFVLLAFLLHFMFVDTGLEYSRSNFVLEQLRLHDNFIFGMLYCSSQGWFTSCDLSFTISFTTQARTARLLLTKSPGDEVGGSNKRCPLTSNFDAKNFTK